jgi:ribosomal protein S28E/S33
MNSIPTGTASETRVWARRIVDRTIADNVLGPVACLPHADVLQLRKVLRQTVPLCGLSAWEKKILREEFRAALGYPYKRNPKMRRRYQLQERDILPSMRDWARKQGILPKPETASIP